MPKALFRSPWFLLLAMCLLVSWSGKPIYSPIQEKWTKLADRTITYTVDHSEIVVDGLSENLDALRVKVKKGAINLHRCVVYYKNNETQQIDVLNSIPAGNESKVIELASPPKTINKLVFTYDTKNRAVQKAEVEIWGRKN